MRPLDQAGSTVCFSILLVFIQYNISVLCKSAQSVAFYARRTTTIFGISGYVKLVTLYCHAIFWGTEGLGEGYVEIMQIVSCLELMANLFIFIHNGGI